MIQEVPISITSTLQTENPSEITPSQPVNNALVSATKSQTKKPRRKSNVNGNTAEKVSTENKNEGTAENNENAVPLHPDVRLFKGFSKKFFRSCLLKTPPRITFRN